MSEKDKMLAGELYDANYDEELIKIWKIIILGKIEKINERGKRYESDYLYRGTDRNKNELIDVDSIIKYTKIWR